jgi:hypothetical protein
MNAKPPRSQRLEGVVQVLILLAIGSMAAAASFTHVHNVAAAHGQPGWLAWADAIVLELMSIATGLEIRRRHRAGQSAGFVLWVLIGAVALSLSAQVVEAERSVIGWLAAALPAGGFLALVKIVLTRTPARTAPVPAVPVVPTAVPDPVPAQDDRDEQDENRGGATDELLDQARAIAAEHRAEHGRPITRDQLRAALGIGTTPATELHRQIKEETTTRPRTVPVPPDAFARVNGTTPTGGAR